MKSKKQKFSARKTENKKPRNFTKEHMDKLAKTSAPKGDVEGVVTEKMLRELCPKKIRAALAKAKTPGQRADLLYAIEHGAYKQARIQYNELGDFLTKLETWFKQTLPKTKATGVTGKLARVEVKPKDIPKVEDWGKFYKHIASKKEFDLLNKAVNRAAVEERWTNDKQVPGVSKFRTQVVSLTSVKGLKK